MSMLGIAPYDSQAQQNLLSVRKPLGSDGESGAERLQELDAKN
jgi:hypothetical protein